MKINGEVRHLWHAIDREDDVLESFFSTTGDKSTALVFIKKMIEHHLVSGEVKQQRCVAALAARRSGMPEAHAGPGLSEFK